MICQLKERYWTLFCPKYCADAVVLSATHASPVRKTFVPFIPPPVEPSFSHCDHRCFTPEPLQLIEISELGMEEMHYEVHVVEQHPPALRQSFHVVGLVLPTKRHQMIRHAPHVCVGGSRRDHEVVRRFRQSPEVQYDYLYRFPVRQSFEDGPEPLQSGGRFPAGTPSTATHSAARRRLFRPPPGKRRPRYQSRCGPREPV